MTPKLSPLPSSLHGMQSVEAPVAWKCGNEFAPYHHQASHINPDHRDGWNACYRAAEAALSAQAAEKDAVIAALLAVKQAISDYHYALDMRQHGGVAQDRAFNAICEAVGMHWWHQGEEKARRAAIDSALSALQDGGKTE